MEREIDSSVVYKLENGYQITKVSAEQISLILRDKNNAVVAIMDVCDHCMINICPYRNRVITDAEKHLMHKFIRSNNYKINNEVAIAFDLSVFREAEGQEEYLSERQLTKRLRSRLKDVHLFVGKLKMHTLRLQSFSKGGVYNFGHAEIKKLIVEKNCDLLIDVRDNLAIEALRVHESFTGSINMSRNTVESIVMGNNCRCDLAIYDSLRCFNLVIADVYSGNLSIKNSCFHGIDVGYYCYAVIKLADNWGRRDITIGDSFRGAVSMDNVDVYNVKVGNDCKGQISISSKDCEKGNHHIKIAEDFAGTLDLRESKTVEQVHIGRHARGKINLLGCPTVKVVKFDKYFSGYADFSESAVEFVHAKYGCSGEMVFLNCENLALLKLPKERNSNITFEKKPLEVNDDSQSLYYLFSKQPIPACYATPLYRRVYDNVKSFLSGEPD